jgi:hypothetical protein
LGFPGDTERENEIGGECSYAVQNSVKIVIYNEAVPGKGT